MCWNCTWGVPKPVAEIYQEALKRLYEIGSYEGPLLHSASHIVWDDYNFHSAQWCLNHFEEYRGDYSDAELEIVKWSLRELIKIPEEIRDYLPDGYRYGDDQELFPPEPGHEMVKI